MDKLGVFKANQTSMCLDLHLNLGWVGAPCTGLNPPVKYSTDCSKEVLLFVDHLCSLFLVFVMLLRLFIAALWSSEGKGLTSWLLIVMFNVILLLSHLVSWDRCGT